MEGRLAVEAQESETLLWYNAHIVDKHTDTFVVKYSDPHFKGQEDSVKESQVRWPAEYQDVDLDQFGEGDLVEVRQCNSDDGAEGWCLAKIISKDDRFLFVHYENYESIYDEIVLVDDIRPINDQEGPKLADIHREAIDVPASVIEWCNSQDCEERLSYVLRKTHCYNISYRPIENQIVAIGDQKPVKKAGILISFILAHQNDIAEIDSNNFRMSKTLEVNKQKAKNEAVEEVMIDKDLVGLIIGKGGSNISYIKQEYGVGIQIIDYSGEEEMKESEKEIPEDKALIRIYGKDAKSVSMAKKEINIQRIMIPIEANKIDYVKGYQNSSINEIREKSKCSKIFLHDPEKGRKEGNLEVIGNEEAIDGLKSLLDTHLSYFKEYQDKDNTSRDLDKKLNKINSNYADALDEGENSKKPQGNPNQKRRTKKY